MATPSAGGAAAAASYFISLYAYIYATGDFVEWDALASPECEFCGGVRNDVEQLHVQGRRSVVEVAVTSSDGLEVDAARWYSADLHVRVSPASDFDADGNQVGSREAEEHEVTVLLTWSGGWIIDEVGPDMKMGG